MQVIEKDPQERESFLSDITEETSRLELLEKLWKTRRAWKGTGMEYTELRDGLMDAVKYLQERVGKEMVDPAQVLSLMGEHQHTIYCQKCMEDAEQPGPDTRVLTICEYCHQSRLCHRNQYTNKVQCFPICKEAFNTELEERITAETALRDKTTEHEGVKRALMDEVELAREEAAQAEQDLVDSRYRDAKQILIIKHQRAHIAKIRTVAEDVCIVEDELRSYLMEFTAPFAPYAENHRWEEEIQGVLDELRNKDESLEIARTRIQELEAQAQRLKEDISGLIRQLSGTFDPAVVAKIETEEQYKLSLDLLQRLVACNLPPGSKESEVLEELAKVVEAYEKEHFPIDPPTPEEVAEFKADQGIEE